MTRNPADDMVIETLAAAEADLIELVADLAWENYRLRYAFARILKITDEARREAREQCNQLWAELADYREAALRREREAA
jgi:hypothetical protein